MGRTAHWCFKRYARAMEIKWLQAIIDVPADAFELETDFWTSVTGTRRGEVHPDHPEFLHLVPLSGDMHLEMQRLNDGPVSVHLDLQVEDIPAAVDRAVSLGATLVAQPGHAVLATPGGMPFCIVPYFGETTRAPVIDSVHPHAVDQICLDVPATSFATDVEFWRELTGWEVNESKLDEFCSFRQPQDLPLRILVQRLGADDRGPARAHLDISSGEHREVVVARHRDAGASLHEEHKLWTAMNSPSGLAYCVTDRAPLRW